jgi:hypothetical protein
MEITKIELRKLTASSGMVLTNGESYGKEIYLGKNDAPENWREITEEEYMALTKAAGNIEAADGEVTA